MIDGSLVDIEAESSGQKVGVVEDLLLGCEGPLVAGFVLYQGLFRTKMIPSQYVRLEGRYLIDAAFRDHSWRPGKDQVVRRRSLWEGEVFCADMWRIGDLRGFDVDTRSWEVRELLVDVVHSLLLGDVDYSKIREREGFRRKGTEETATVHGSAGMSRRSIFLSASGDRGASTFGRIQGGERTSSVVIPAEGCRFRPGGTVRLPIKGSDLERITVELVNSGELERGGRRDIVRNVFKEYYRRSEEGEPASAA